MRDKAAIIVFLFMGTGSLGGCGSTPEIADTTPPALVNATLSCERAAAGQTIAVTLTTSEDSGSAPIVTLALTTPRTMTATHDLAPYEYSYVVIGDEEEGEVLIEASLTDDAGNTAREGIGVVTLDFTGPSVGAINFGNTQHLRAGSTGVISFLVDDALGSEATATFTNSGALDGTALEYLLTHSGLPAFTYTASGDEPEGATEISLDLTDTVGNDATSGPFDGFIFDFTDPQVQGDPNPTSELVSLGAQQTVEVRFTTNEELQKADVFIESSADGTTIDLYVTDGDFPNTYIASRQVANRAPFAPGFWDIKIVLTDLADNKAAVFTVATPVELVD